MKLTGIRLENIRVFEGEHFVAIGEGLTVLVGRNNAGKSTELRAPFVFLQSMQNSEARLPQIQRIGAKCCSITLELKPRPGDWRRLGFGDNPLDQVALGTGVLSKHPAFRDWPAYGLLEVGVERADPPSGSEDATNRFNGRVVVFRGRDRSDTVVLDALGHGRAEIGSNHPALGPTGAIPHLAFTEGQTPAPNHFAFWEHHRDERTSEVVSQPTRRVQDTSESRVLEVLTFLRLKHPREFERISDALRSAFPEFGGLDFIDTQNLGFTYRPGFSREGTLLAREAIGNGAWAYLCILTAARAAKVTGAQVLFLDEPHLYLHPALERMLIDELLDSERWDGSPLQIVAATHSPTFVNEAVERGTLNVLEWEDDKRTKVRVNTLRSGDNSTKAFECLGMTAGDMLYTERIVFVEGPSDVVALRLLGEKRCGLRRDVRFVPLHAPDSVAPEIARFFSVVQQAQGHGVHARSLLILDGDKKKKLEAAWEKGPAERDPRKVRTLELVWSSARGNDLESAFCDEGFLSAYFVSRKINEQIAGTAIRKHLEAVGFPAERKDQKGCTAIRTMHAELLGDQDGSGRKADDLENLMQFYLREPGGATRGEVKKNLEHIEAALRKLCGTDRAHG